MKNCGPYGPIVGGCYLIQAECETFEEAQRLSTYLNRAQEVEHRLELAEEALREFAYHSQGVQAPNAKFKAWRDFLNREKGGK